MRRAGASQCSPKLPVPTPWAMEAVNAYWTPSPAMNCWTSASSRAVRATSGAGAPRVGFSGPVAKVDQELCHAPNPYRDRGARRAGGSGSPGLLEQVDQLLALLAINSALLAWSRSRWLSLPLRLHSLAREVQPAHACGPRDPAASPRSPASSGWSTRATIRLAGMPRRSERACMTILRDVDEAHERELAPGPIPSRTAHSVKPLGENPSCEIKPTLRGACSATGGSIRRSSVPQSLRKDYTRNPFLV